jgi:acyl-CoA thioester hydrolase
MTHEFHYRRRIEFADTDMAGIVHFANYFRYMEMAEHAFLRSLGLSVHAEIDGRVVSWPRVKAECLFRAPLRFEEELDVHLLVREKRAKSITYDFQMSNQDGRPVAHGSVKVACVAMDGENGGMTSIRIPACIDEKIDVAPVEQLKQQR